jgi:hypothetical protein
MKKIIGWLTICASLGAVAAIGCANVYAQAATQAGCTPEAKQAWYTEFRANFKTDQAKAYDLAKKYLACPVDPAEKQVADYLTNYVNLVDKANRTPKLTELVYEKTDKKDYAKIFELGKQILADEPENVKVYVDLAYAGYLAASSKNDTYVPDTLNYAKKAIQLIQAGKAPDNWAPYTGKDDALSYLDNTIGVLTLPKNPSEALPFLLKAAQFEGKLKKQAITYGYIAAAYEQGPYDKLSADYKAKFEGKDETPESKLALENINQVIDRMIDALARAVSLSGSEAATQAAKKAWMESLTTWYKYRHNQTEAGLPELIASVMSKPLPPEPTPLTTLPTPPATTTTPSSGTNGNGGSSATTGPAASTAPAAATSPTSTPKTNAAAATTTSAKAPVKPKTRNNHKRH